MLLNAVVQTTFEYKIVGVGIHMNYKHTKPTCSYKCVTMREYSYIGILLRKLACGAVCVFRETVKFFIHIRYDDLQCV